MKRYLGFLLTGIFFGIVLTKSEAISWFRIQEMFRFQSIHMYGIIGVAVISGILIYQGIRLWKWKTLDGTVMDHSSKEKTYKAAFLGGSVFGLGWALTGACPGPLYVLIGNGYWIVLVILVSAILGTMVYGMVRSKLPH